MESAAARGGITNEHFSSRRRVAAALVASIITTGGLWYFLTRSERPTPETQAAILPDDDASLPATVVVNPGYLGVEACAPCHTNRVRDFRGTRHAVAATPPRPEAMPRHFTDGHGTHLSHDKSVRFEMSRTGSDYLETAIRSTPHGEQRAACQIGMVYGSGGALDEVFFAWKDDRLYELPVTYLHPQDCWANVTFSPNGSGDFSREATTRCMECHNTWFEHAPGTSNEYHPGSFIYGVGCERCHGPGREHVAHHQSHPGDAAAAIVHPGKLSRDRLIEVCAQCHSNAHKPRGPALAYRPGEPLDEYYRTAITQHREEDHVANQTKYMRESKCFQKTDTLTCVTCHDPHRPANLAATRAACAGCHQPEQCREQPKLPAAVRDDCVGCHMPPRIWMNVHFHTADDLFLPPIRRFEHRIGVYPEATNATLLAWYRTRSDQASKDEAGRLVRSLSDHWLTEADRRSRDRRYIAAIGAVREALRVDDTRMARDKLREFQTVQSSLLTDLSSAIALTERRQYRSAIAAYKRVLADHPDNAVAHGKLGTLFALTGEPERAAEHLREVARCDPNDAYGENMLGWLALQDGRAEEAAEAFRRAEVIEPYSADLRYRWGLSLLALGRNAEAEARFRATLAVDPDHPGGHQGLSHALREQGRFGEAVPYARRAVRLTGEKNADALVSLGDAYTAAGRAADAVLAFEKALETASADNPGLRETVARKLADARARASVRQR